MSIVDLVALFADFESRPFPETWTYWEHDGLTVRSNAGGHAIVLAESEEFWDDDDGSAAQEAWERMLSLSGGIEAAATAAWGDPRVVDVDPRVMRDEASPFTELLTEHGAPCGDFWVCGDRAVGLCTCQMDEETAIEIVAFVVPSHEVR